MFDCPFINAMLKSGKKETIERMPQLWIVIKELWQIKKKTQLGPNISLITVTHSRWDYLFYFLSTTGLSVHSVPLRPRHCTSYSLCFPSSILIPFLLPFPPLISILLLVCSMLWVSLISIKLGQLTWNNLIVF